MDMATVEMHIQEHRQTIEQHGFRLLCDPKHDDGITLIRFGYADKRPHIFEFVHMPMLGSWRIGMLTLSIYSADEIKESGIPTIDPFVPSTIIPILPSLIELAYGVAIQMGWKREWMK
jgi:hypothetical protein